MELNMYFIKVFWQGQITPHHKSWGFIILLISEMLLIKQLNLLNLSFLLLLQLFCSYMYIVNFFFLKWGERGS